MIHSIIPASWQPLARAIIELITALVNLATQLLQYFQTLPPPL